MSEGILELARAVAVKLIHDGFELLGAGGQRLLEERVDVFHIEGVAFTSFSAILSWMFLDIGVPLPRTTGVTRMRNSSIRPSRINVATRSALPNSAVSCNSRFGASMKPSTVTLICCRWDYGPGARAPVTTSSTVKARRRARSGRRWASHAPAWP